jgi:oligopeptide/dipeptide ABC transporter ATP-binding protein
MYAGRVMETGGNPEIFDHPSHPYTKGLLAAIPSGGGQQTRPIPGSVPEPWATPPGCVFAPRCDYAIPSCLAGQPPLEPVGNVVAQLSACLRRREIIAGTAEKREMA